MFESHLCFFDFAQFLLDYYINLFTFSVIYSFRKLAFGGDMAHIYSVVEFKILKMVSVQFFSKLIFYYLGVGSFLSLL